MFPRRFAKEDLKEKWWALWYFLRNTVLKLTNFALFTVFFSHFFPFTPHIRIIWMFFFIRHKCSNNTSAYIIFKQTEMQILISFTGCIFDTFYWVHNLAEVWGVFPFDVSFTEKDGLLKLQKLKMLISYTSLFLSLLFN